MTPSFIYLFIINGFQWHHMPSDLNSLLTHIVFGENTMPEINSSLQNNSFAYHTISYLSRNYNHSNNSRK